MASVRDSQADKRLLRLVHDVGCIDAVVSEIVIVESAAPEAEAALVASPCIDGTQNECDEGRPISPIQGQLFDLFRFDRSPESSRGLVKLRIKSEALTC
jgi:hypothetical protein